MNAGAIRDKLCDYIRVADDKKIKAIYMMLEDEIDEETEWWKNTAFFAELEKEYAVWESGKGKGYSFAEVKAEITSRKAKNMADDLQDRASSQRTKGTVGSTGTMIDGPD